MEKRQGALDGAAPMTASEKAAAMQGSRSEAVFEEVQYRLKEAGLADKIQLFHKIQSGDQAIAIQTHRSWQSHAKSYPSKGAEHANVK